MNGKLTDTDKMFEEISDFASKTSGRQEDLSLKDINPPEEIQDSIDIEDYVSSVENEADEKNENFNMILDEQTDDSAFFEISDVDPDFIKNEIINIAKDFIVRSVTGIPDVNSINVFQFIESRKDEQVEISSDSNLSSNIVESEGISEYQSVLTGLDLIDKIGNNVIDISSLSEEEYQKLFYPENGKKKDIISKQEVYNDKYSRVEIGSEHFVDLDLLFGLSVSGRYSKPAYSAGVESEIIEEM